MSNTQLTYIRTGATAAITALAALYALYPSYIWITVIISAASAVGIHAIPSIQQGVTTVVPVSTPKEIVTMSEQPEVAQDVAPEAPKSPEIDGLALMGLRAPVTDAEQPDAVPTPDASPAPEASPVADPAPETPSVVGVTVHLSDGTSKTF